MEHDLDPDEHEVGSEFIFIGWRAGIVSFRSEVRSCGRVRVDCLSERVEELLAVVVKVAVDLCDGPVLDDPELALRLPDEPLVVRDEDHAALELVHRLRQRLDRLHVKVVRRLVLKEAQKTQS